ncbi:MAG: class I tRNA ligase family protein, partial [Muribaculaceae bacterium]|nr:class I tRNA ligase family protein [Muribaculaceae bacterium]
VAQRPEIDRWILSQLNSLIAEVNNALEDFEPTRAARAIAAFVDEHLSNWYVRLNRKRFWGSDMDDDKLAAYQTLYTCLETVARLMAPFAPFYAHRLYADLAGTTGHSTKASVHLESFPKADPTLIDADLERRMQLAQTITSMVLALRRKANQKVRQPLQTIMIPPVNAAQRADIESMSQLILTEVNVKNLEFVEPDAGVLVKKIKPDFKKLGAKHGKLMKQVANAINAMSQQEIIALESNGTMTLTIEGNPIDIALDEVTIVSEDIPGWLVTNEGNVTVALDVTVTPELRAEGMARELINRIQNIRKGRDYNITDRITVTIAPNELVDDALRLHSDYIAGQVLANAINVAPLDTVADDETLDIDGNIVTLNIALDK